MNISKIPFDKEKEYTNEQLAEFIQKGNKEALDKLLQNNKGLILSIVKRFLNRNYEQEDLYQIGCLALIKAVKRFDIRFKVKLTTYAVPVIMGDIRRHIRDNRMVRVSRRLKELSLKIYRAKNELMAQLDREPVMSEIAEYLNIEVEELSMAAEAVREPESLFTYKTNEETKKSYIDKIEDSSNDNEDKIIEKLALFQAIEKLPDKEKKILKLRYFENKTQVEVAELFGISQVHVSRLEKKILKNLREKIV